MGKIVLFNMMTLDGFFEGANRDIDWHNTDQEFNDFAVDQMNSADGLLFGRVTYQLMANYWPTPEAIRNDALVAGMMNRFSKVVFSRTLDKADWENTRLVRGDAGEEVAKLRDQPGRDLLIFGSANLASSLAPRGLVDEYRVMINPVLLGAGTPLFQGVQNRQKLQLLKSRIFRSGNVLLYYAPAAAVQATGSQ